MTLAAENFIEDKKNRLLAALYDHDYKTCESLFHQICDHAQNQTRSSENHEKRLRQIFIIFKRFKSALVDHCSPKISLYYNRLKQMLSDSTRTTAHLPRTICFEPWENSLDLSQCQKDLLYKTVMTFQLTSGCSNYCRRCNEWALPGVRSHFSFSAIIQIFDHIANQENTHISLYGASDPLDWMGSQKDINDIIDAATARGIDYSLLTKLPKGKKELLKKLIANGANLSVSMTNKNKEKILDLEQKIGQPISKQHDTDELLIPAGLDEDFVSVKPSITDGYGCEITPDGAYIVIPTFTSALYPFGHAKIPVTKDTLFFPEKKTGRPALLVDYFKPLKGFDKSKKKVTLDCLLPVQIESVLLDNGRYELTPPGMRSMKEYLSIFDEKARLQRQKMTPVVKKKLNQHQASQKKIQAHLDMCHLESCLDFKLYALSFFLDAVVNYQNRHNLTIILFLLKKERKKRGNADFFSDRNPSVESLLKDPNIDSFDLFRRLVFHLTTQPGKSEQILSFIKKYASVYDPTIDLFISTK